MKAVLISIRTEGHSRIIAVTKFIPSDWQYVEVSAVKKDENTVTLKFKKVSI